MIPGVITTGNIVIDVLTHPVDEIQWGGTRWVDSITQSLGGNGANTSAALGKFGIPVRLIGAIGNDPFGDAALARLQDCRVDTTWIQRLPANTATTVALVRSTGARAFLHQPGVSRLVFADPIDLTTLDTTGFTRLHIGNPFAITHLRPFAPKLLSQAKQLGLQTSLDTAWDALGEWMTILAPSLPLADILFVNEDEAKMLVGSDEPNHVQRAFADLGATTIVLKRGPQGSVVITPGEITAIPAFPVKAIDTTGAGDCFAGGFLAALQRGYTYPEAARLANAVGALNVQSIGATTGLLSWPELLEWVESNEQKQARQSII